MKYGKYMGPYRKFKGSYMRYEKAMDIGHLIGGHIFEVRKMHFHREREHYVLWHY